MHLAQFSNRILPRVVEVLRKPAGFPSVSQGRGNAWRASLGRVGRSQYLLRYPVRLIRPEGSSVETRASEPRQVVQLAVDLKALSDDERRQRLAARKPKVKQIKQEVIDDNFDVGEYMKMWGAEDSGSANSAIQPPTQKKAGRST